MLKCRLLKVQVALVGVQGLESWLLLLSLLLVVPRVKMASRAAIRPRPR
jgi:hypothetical protein